MRRIHHGSVAAVYYTNYAGDVPLENDPIIDVPGTDQQAR
jgi:hypothetical protein